MSEDKIVKKIHNDLIVKNIERETNYAIKCDFDFVYLDVDDVKVLLENYKKQSKEIEKLKANKGYHLGFIDGGIAKRYEYEDKIKAKIEEVSNGTYDAKIVLQSLLEKE